MSNDAPPDRPPRERDRSPRAGPPRLPGEEPSPLVERATWIAIGVGLLAAVVIVYKTVGGWAHDDTEPATSAPSSSAEPSASAVAPAPPRCAELAPTAGLTVGEPPAARPKPADADGGAGDPGAAEPDDDDTFAPFAVEVGAGTTFEGGFAAGVQRAAEGGTVAMVATVAADGTGGKLVRLARSRGDLDAPTVAGAGKSVLVAMLEPNAGGRAIKIARVTGDEVTWGPELSEGRDESLAVGLAASGGGAAVAWDDVSPDGKRAGVFLATLDPVAMKTTSPARPVSSPDVDADGPRVAARPGGYWLAYVAHGPAPKADAADGGKKDAPKPAKKKSDDEDDVDETRGGEVMEASWLEVVPLDEAGKPTGAQQRVTPREGHVLAYDLEALADGGALLAWRDDDTPSGSGGGTISMATVTSGGVSLPRIVADDSVGSGVPSLLPGWVVVADMNGRKRLAALDPAGQLVGSLTDEPSLGTGEPIAATSGGVLVARPAGKAMRLSVVRCSP